MNNQFNSANVTNQHGIQMAQHVATSPPQASAAVLNTFLNAHQQQQQQFATAVSAGSIYSDPRHLHLNSNNIDKNYFTTASATLGALGTAQRFYTTAGSAAAGSGNSTVVTSGVQHPNTILITNNFTHQQVAQPLNSEQPRNLRIVTSGGNPLNSNTGSLATTGGGFQHSQHVFNINSNKHLQHLFPQHLLQQQNFQPTAAPTELMQQHFTAQHYSSSQPNLSAAPAALQMPQFYVSAENAVAPLNTNPKILTNIPSHTTTSATENNVAPLVSNSSNNTNPNNNSTVVLDRINICINNLYTDTSSSSSASNSLASTPAQQPSPIIPAIQHKAVMENGIALPIATDIYESNVLIIDEPDSTTTATTPHTPPTTPENTPPTMPNNANNNNNNNNNNIISTTSTFNSPSTSCNHQQLDKSNAITTTKQSFSLVAQNIEKAAQDSTNAMDTSTDKTSKSLSQEQNAQTTQNITSNSPLTPPTPPSPAVSNNDSNKNYQTESNEASTLPPPPLFSNGEDVFIKRHDGRFYLGTVIDTARNQFLVRFDDKTEVWCDAEEMRKLTGSASNNNASSAEEKTSDQPMCVACKRSQPDSKVEICERCGRGYHRKCTSETLPGSEVWLCKRCVKPMKLDDYSKFSSTEEETELETIHQLHYNIESLTWDAKHHMNMEQIYCYCGKTGKFDNNMLQCWRCLNWYHTYCIQKFNGGNILRGDNFFVFCCSVCNGGGEYLRRLQANWVDLAHLALYSLSTMKKHQKFYHLQKDINPFVLEKKKMFPIPKEWLSWPEKQFLDKIKFVLNDNPDLFMCGKEVKRDHNLFALRIIEPPLVKKFNISQHDKLNDKFIFNVLKLQVLLNAPENADYKFQNTYLSNVDITPKSKPKMNEDSSSHDVYEFDDSSDDDIPVKRKLDKVKKQKLSPLTEAKAVRAEKTKATSTKPISSLSTTTLEKMDVEDDNANDAVINRMPDIQSKNDNTISAPRIEMAKKELTAICPQKSASDNNGIRKEESLNTIKKLEKSSRKRKAFTLSKSYNDMRLSDSSSDENSSSSSRGTSLDLIIPPPKNFFGQNNPFRIISPKKSSIDGNTASTSSGKKSVSFDIFNATRLNFSSKYAGLFPKLSTTNLAKAAGQPRTVRTIKRRLSAKDITIGPNKEVRRRRTRRLSSNIEIISTTTINPIPTNFFPIQAKDLLAAAAATTTTAASLFTTTQNKTSSMISSSSLSNVNSSTSCSPTTESTNMQNTNVQTVSTHGRRLRQRPQKNSPNTSRRSSISSNQSSNSSVSASAIAVGTTAQASNPSDPSHEDLKQTVNKYFGIVNRIESGEQFSIRAKRQLPNGQMQYLIEWGETQLPHQTITTPSHANALITNTTDQITTNNQIDEISST